MKIVTWSILFLACLPAWAGVRLRIVVDRPGIHHLPSSALIRAGLDRRTEARRLRMTDRGKEMALWIPGEEKGALVETGGVYFLAGPHPLVHTNNPHQPRYRAEWVYFLEAGAILGKRMREAKAGLRRGRGASTHARITRFEKQKTFFGRMKGRDDDDRWFEVILLKGGKTARLRPDHDIRFDLPDYAGGRAQATIAVQGLRKETLHRLRVEEAAGSVLHEFEFAGQSAHRASFELGTAARQGNFLRLRLVSPGTDAVFHDWLEVAYRAHSRPTAGRLRLTAAGAVTVEGVGQSPLLFDVGGPDPVRILAPASWRGGISIDLGSAPRTIEIVAAASAAKVRAIAPAPAGFDFDSPRQADYIVVVPGAWMSQVAPLLKLRARQKLAAVAVPLQEIFDRFGGGNWDPAALRGFAEHAHGRWRGTRPGSRPRYLLLVGDGTQDPFGHVKAGGQVMPIRLVVTDYLCAASDHWFVAFGPRPPAMSIGRLPVRTRGELAAMVRRILEHEKLAASYRRRSVVLVADNPDRTYDFHAAARSLTGLIPAPLATHALLLGKIPLKRMRRELPGYLASGALLVNYIGHGKPDSWADERILTTTEVASLPPSRFLPVVVAMNCANATFQFPKEDCIGEAFVKAPGRGAIAFWGSTSYCYAPPQKALNRAFLRALFARRTARLGDAIDKAKRAIAGEKKARDVIYSWVLLGDPALGLRW